MPLRFKKADQRPAPDGGKEEAHRAQSQRIGHARLKWIIHAPAPPPCDWSPSSDDLGDDDIHPHGAAALDQHQVVGVKQLFAAVDGAPCVGRRVQICAAEAGFRASRRCWHPTRRPSPARRPDRRRAVPPSCGLRSRSCPVRACRPARPRAVRPPRLTSASTVQRGNCAGRAGVVGVVDQGAAVDAGHGDQAQLPGRICKPATISAQLKPSTSPTAAAPAQCGRCAAQQRHLDVQRFDLAAARRAGVESGSGCLPCPCSRSRRPRGRRRASGRCGRRAPAVMSAIARTRSSSQLRIATPPLSARAAPAPVRPWPGRCVRWCPAG
jgi:hypothetical protein